MDYWQKRQEAIYKAGEMQVNQYFKRLEKAFNQTKRELQKTIEAFYFRYAEENGLSFAAAQKRLNAEELGELDDFIALAMDNIGKYNQQVNNMSLKARVTRYQALEMQVDAILRQVYAIDYQAESEKAMQEVYEDTYYRTWYSIDQYHGFHQAFAQVEPRVVEKLLEYPFNGAAFSSRLWKQKDHLQTQLTEAVTTMLIQGRHPSTLTREFAKKMQSKKFDAYRLLHTESSFLMSAATHTGYKEDGVEKYEILATLDSKTCEICGELDGNVYEVGEEVTGVNMPPFHPLCRCTDVPHYEDTPTKGMARVARDPETGKTYMVPADMTYKQWREQYVEKNPDKRLAERKLKNKKADNEQFQRYGKILGKDAPETLDSFQTMKYTDSEKWNAKKREFATISKIMEKESYSEEYRSKMRSIYYRFKDKGYEFTDHSLNRYLGQKTGRGKRAFTEDELLKVLDSSVNYLEEGGRTVKFYNGIAAIQNEQTEEVVSIVVRNKPKKGWGSK